MRRSSRVARIKCSKPNVQTIGREVGIFHRRLDGGMAHPPLDYDDRSPVLHQAGACGVPEGVEAALIVLRQSDAVLPQAKKVASVPKGEPCFRELVMCLQPLDKALAGILSRLTNVTDRSDDLTCFHEVSFNVEMLG